MSFVKTLAAVAAGVLGTRAYDRIRDMGGMDAVQKKLREAGAAGGLAEQAGEMAARLGMPGAEQKIRETVAEYAPRVADASQAAEDSFGRLLSSLQGSAAAGAGALGGLVSAATGMKEPTSAPQEEAAKRLIRVMIEAAKADGEIDADEQARIINLLAGSSDDERAFVEAELVAGPADPVALGKEIPAAEREQAYGAALIAVSVENPREAEFLRKFAEGMGLDPAARDALHQRLGQPAPGGA